MSINNKKILVYIIYVLSIFCLCSFVAWNSQYNSGPDEFARFPLADYFMNNFSLPDASDPSIRIPAWGYSYGAQPYIPQIISGLLMNLSWDYQSMIFMARMPSVLFIIGYSIFCILIAEKLFKESTFKWMFIVFTTILPQILYIGSYMNNECIALMSSAMIVYCWIIGLESKWNWKSCVWLGISCSVCLLSYYTAYGFCLCSAILFCFDCYNNKMSFKKFIIKTLFILGIVLILAGWFFIRNIVLYNGDVFGLELRRIDGELYADPGLKPSDRANNLGGSEFVDDRVSAVLLWLPKTIKSFIGNFGYMTLGLPVIIYVFYIGVFLLGLIAYAIYNRKFEILQLFLILAIVIPFVLSLIYSFTEDYQPQGRYVITAVIPIIYFVSRGYESLQVKLSSVVIYRVICVLYYLVSAAIIIYVGIVL